MTLYSGSNHHFCSEVVSSHEATISAGTRKTQLHVFPSNSITRSPGRGCCSGRKSVRFGKSAQKYPRVPRNVWSGVSGTEHPNMKLVLVKHPGTESYRLPIRKHRNILTLRPGTEPGTEFRFELPAKFGSVGQNLGSGAYNYILR